MSQSGQDKVSAIRICQTSTGESYRKAKTDNSNPEGCNQHTGPGCSGAGSDHGEWAAGNLVHREFSDEDKSTASKAMLKQARKELETAGFVKDESSTKHVAGTKMGRSAAYSGGQKVVESSYKHSDGRTATLTHKANKYGPHSVTVRHAQTKTDNSKPVQNVIYITANIGRGHARRATLDGRQYLVAPLTLIVPGVLNGSQGALYYPPDEIARNHQEWGDVPLTVYHPETKDGKPASASGDGVLDRQGIGFVRKPHISNTGKLRAEGWFDVERMRKVDARVLNSLERGEPIELSTGLFTDNERAENGSADPKGKPYSHVARNYRPDHLAILPDQKGACSLKDGCGVLVNGDEPGHPFRGNQYSGGGGSSHKERLETARKSGKNVRRTKTGYTETDKHGKVHYSHEGHITGFEPSVSSHVQRFGPKTRNTSSPETTMNRKQTIKHLVSNCECWKGKENVLANEEAFSDEDIKRLKANADKARADGLVANAARSGFKDGDVEYKFDPEEDSFVAVENADDEEVVDEEDDEEPPPKKGKGKGKKKFPFNRQEPTVNKTEAEWMKSAPESVKRRLAYAERVENREKLGIVQKLVANIEDDERRQKRGEKLMTNTVAELEEMLELLPAQTREPAHVFDFSGASIPTGNRSEPKYDDKDVEIPTLNWSEMAKERGVKSA
jgi:hypothetical protein